MRRACRHRSLPLRAHLGTTAAALRRARRHRSLLAQTLLLGVPLRRARRQRFLLAWTLLPGATMRRAGRRRLLPAARPAVRMAISLCWRMLSATPGSSTLWSSWTCRMLRSSVSPSLAGGLQAGAVGGGSTRRWGCCLAGGFRGASSSRSRPCLRNPTRGGSGSVRAPALWNGVGAVEKVHVSLNYGWYELLCDAVTSDEPGASLFHDLCQLCGVCRTPERRAVQLRVARAALTRLAYHD